MGLLNVLFTKNEQSKQLQNYWKTLTAYAPVFRSWDGQLYESEIVRSAIDVRARHISKLRIEVKGSAKPKLQTMLKKRPNNFQTWSQFLYRTSTILDMNNTCFIVPVLDRNLEISGYFSLVPTQCEVLEDGLGRPWLRYEFNNGERAAIEFERVGILTKYQYKDDLFGSSNTALTETMKLLDLQNQGISEAVRSGATYRFMAQANNFAKPDDLAKERKRFTEDNLSGEGGGLLLFPNTYTNIAQIKNSPFTIDTEQLNLIQRNVFNYFGVNEDILQSKAIGDDWNAFYESVVEHFAIQISEVLTKMTFTDTETSFGAEIIATSNRLQYMSNKDKATVSSQLLDRGVFSINEAREMWNLPPIKDGDAHIIRGEYYNVDDKVGNAQEGATDGEE